MYIIYTTIFCDYKMVAKTDDLMFPQGDGNYVQTIDELESFPEFKLIAKIDDIEEAASNDEACINRIPRNVQEHEEYLICRDNV